VRQESRQRRLPHARGTDLTIEEAAFLRELFDRDGLDVHVYRTETLRRRLPACLRAFGATSIRSARQMLEKSPTRVNQAVEAAVIGVTAFFRDASVFEQIATDVLPILAAKRGGPLRVWSAGCSDGQELYSAAMQLCDRDLLGRSELLGTDCRSSAIAQAREGSYEAGALNEMPALSRSRYFQQVGTRHQVRAALRERAHWRRADVTQFAEPGPWDLIFCRNLTMYFQPAVAGEVWHRLEQTLRPGGFLLLGKAERPNGATRVAPYAPCIYRKIA
jgi:chemotaxis protein methyltransferase CheR